VVCEGAEGPFRPDFPAVTETDEGATIMFEHPPRHRIMIVRVTGGIRTLAADGELISPTYVLNLGVGETMARLAVGRCRAFR
jgi:hypothetical protein